MGKVTTKKPRGSAKGTLDLKKRLEDALRQAFPHDTVDVSDGYRDNVHVLVVSRRFDDLSDKSRYALLWRLVEGSGLTAAQKDRISVLLGLSPGEIK
jgi:hypothetical protein